MIKINIEIEELPVGPGKTGGRVQAESFGGETATEEEHRISKLIFDLIKIIAEKDLGEKLNAQVKMKEWKVNRGGEQSKR